MSAVTLEQLRAAFPQASVGAAGGFGPVVTLGAATELPAALAAFKALKPLPLDVCEDYTALDAGEVFILVLHLVSGTDVRARVTLKAPVPKAAPAAPSLVAQFGIADWYEREIFDMFGIRFHGHPDLRRILLPEDWTGYPLRKDYTDDKLLKRPGA
ncbi:MAG: NADH-quinone oxidoreductase subunit C [Candidatus Firestonebacteria bacterium]|nr:NADH-quinone oxidoreductase subunit C [Candidatus Firestonebacteria bacterium]